MQLDGRYVCVLAIMARWCLFYGPLIAFHCFVEA